MSQGAGYLLRVHNTPQCAAGAPPPVPRLSVQTPSSKLGGVQLGSSRAVCAARMPGAAGCTRQAHCLGDPPLRVCVASAACWVTHAGRSPGA